MKQEKRSVIVLLVVAGCVLYMISGGIRSSFGVVVQALAGYRIQKNVTRIS